MYQVLELGNLADYVKKKLKFQAAVGVTAREDWPELQEERIMDIVNLVKNLLKKTHAEKVILGTSNRCWYWDFKW